MREIFTLALSIMLPISLFANEAKEAKKVIERFAGGKLPINLSISLEKQNGCDIFETSVEEGELTIKGSSGVALCRGFYEYVKDNGLGISSWTGNRLEWPAHIENSAPQTTISPFKHHYYFNVVTFGYTMPYWDWERWEQEIDWMALHGVDMPLALVANEAISARVWKKMGLTDEEIAEYFVGPAHFPWMRMGNISGVDSPLPESWHKTQIALQHKILKRMKALGMKPICPAFSGFVPKAMQRVLPDAKLIETSWCGGEFHNWMLSPDTPQFQKIGEMFIEEWEKEFGENGYYIADSFNEMEIPFPPKGTEERYTLLADYGEKVYNSIKAGSPDAVWVMQGWMFGYQRHIWDYETLGALVSRVPNNKMLLLDLAVDYNKCFWHSETNWNFYKGLFGKEWVYSVIPNMGGKTGLTGVLEVYANGRLEALNSPNRGELAGYGMAPEGIENNEVLYELICDAGWHNKKIDVDEWLNNYTICRYGKTNDHIKEYWAGMRNSVYGTFTDHPRYNWQFRPGLVSKGTINANEEFYMAVESLMKASPELKESPLYKTDMIEMTVHYIGGKMEILTQAIEAAYQTNNIAKAEELEQEFEVLALAADRLLSSHPILNLQRWIDFARDYGKCKAQKNYYERNARRIVTVWGPPVDDYSARIWSGLIRDYYLPRWKQYFESKRTGKANDIAAWELNWVSQNGTSPITPYQDIFAACGELLQQASRITPELIAHINENNIGSWSPADVVANQEKELQWNIPVEKLSQLKGISFHYTKGANNLTISEVVLTMDGVDVCNISTTNAIGANNPVAEYNLTIPQGATGNNSCQLRVKVRGNDGNDSHGVVVMTLK